MLSKIFNHSEFQKFYTVVFFRCQQEALVAKWIVYLSQDPGSQLTWYGSLSTKLHTECYQQSIG